MGESEIALLAGWVVEVQARCPDCGEVHVMRIMATELVGAAMDADGVYFDEQWCICGCCYGAEVA